MFLDIASGGTVSKYWGEGRLEGGKEREGVIHNPVTGQSDCRPNGIPGEPAPSADQEALGKHIESLDRPKLEAMTRLFQLIFTFMPSTFLLFLDEWKTSDCPEARMIERLKQLTPELRGQIASACLEIAYREFGPVKFGEKMLELTT